MNPTRRSLLKAGAIAPVAAASLLSSSPIAAAAEADTGKGKVVKNGRIKQSVMGWCFKPIKAEDLAEDCADMGMHAMEGVPSSAYPRIKELGMEIALVGSHGFGKGPVDPANHEHCRKKLIDGIDLAVKFGSKSVITFTGMTVKDLSAKQMDDNCVELWKSVIGHAEEKGITLCLEHLNSRDDSHPMKGHPGYYGDDMDHCIELIERVGSKNFKVLFDIYHVQVMNGDVIRRIRQYKDHIGHVHTAGNPGRCEIDEKQEIYYPAIMEALLEVGYEGFVAQEFLPTWDDKIKALRHAVGVCDV